MDGHLQLDPMYLMKHEAGEHAFDEEGDAASAGGLALGGGRRGVGSSCASHVLAHEGDFLPVRQMSMTSHGSTTDDAAAYTSDTDSNGHSSARSNKKRPWSAEEDEHLRVLVQQLGPRDWGKIAAQLVNRNGKQCHQRWNYFLSPSVLRTAWSQEEDQSIVYWQQAIGNKWAKIATYLPGRTGHAVKNRWHQLHNKLRKIRHTGGHSSCGGKGGNGSTSTSKTGRASTTTAAAAAAEGGIRGHHHASTGAASACSSSSPLAPSKMLPTMTVGAAITGGSKKTGLMRRPRVTVEVCGGGGGDDGSSSSAGSSSVSMSSGGPGSGSSGSCFYGKAREREARAAADEEEERLRLVALQQQQHAILDLQLAAYHDEQYQRQQEEQQQMLLLQHQQQQLQLDATGASLKFPWQQQHQQQQQQLPAASASSSGALLELVDGALPLEEGQQGQAAAAGSYQLVLAGEGGPAGQGGQPLLVHEGMTYAPLCTSSFLAQHLPQQQQQGQQMQGQQQQQQQYYQVEVLSAGAGEEDEHRWQQSCAQQQHQHQQGQQEQQEQVLLAYYYSGASSSAAEGQGQGHKVLGTLMPAQDGSGLFQLVMGGGRGGEQDQQPPPPQQQQQYSLHHLSGGLGGDNGNRAAALAFLPHQPAAPQQPPVASLLQLRELPAGYGASSALEVEGQQERKECCGNELLPGEEGAAAGRQRAYMGEEDGVVGSPVMGRLHRGPQPVVVDEEEEEEEEEEDLMIHPPVFEE